MLKYNKATKNSDTEAYQQRRKHDLTNVLTPVPRSSISKGSKGLTATWAINEKSNGTFAEGLMLGVMSKYVGVITCQN